jgi:hypothetical protein
LKAGTKKADEIHDYYMKMEDMIQDIIHEESDELKLQLEQSNHKLEQTNLFYFCYCKFLKLQKWTFFNLVTMEILEIAKNAKKTPFQNIYFHYLK